MEAAMRGMPVAMLTNRLFLRLAKDCLSAVIVLLFSGLAAGYAQPASDVAVSFGQEDDITVLTLSRTLAGGSVPMAAAPL